MHTSSPPNQHKTLLEKFDRESVTRRPKNIWVRRFISMIAIGYALFHLYTTYYPMAELLYRATHVAIGLSLIYLIYPTNRAQHRGKIPWYDWVLATLPLISLGYLCQEYQAIMTTRGGIPNTVDIIFAIATVILVFEATRRIMGWILPILAGLFLLYPFISHQEFVPNILLTRNFDLGDIFGHMYLKTEGLYSIAIGASVSFIFLFILFGAFLTKSGMGQLFNELALSLAGSKKGGPAKVAVIASGFMGSINGTAVGNVVATGAFTIPLMKKVGYQKNFAGAVEASASVGGQILPPIMGASAFIMAETTGIKYGTIALAALIPALLYYLGVLAQVHFRAGKDNLQGMAKDDLVRLPIVLKERGHLLLPIVLLVYLLYQSMPVSFAALYTIMTTIVISSLRHTTRMSFRDICTALEEGSRQSLSVMCACAVVGIIIGVVSLTSFGTVMVSLILRAGAGSLFLTLLFTLFAAMVLGMGLPSIPAYLITATMVAPVLATFDVPILVAHLFVFYFGLFANLTPPVALAAFAAAGISGGDPMHTGFQSLKLSLAGFMVPFIFVYNPALLMIDTTGLPTFAREFPYPTISAIAVVSLSAITGIIALSAAIEGFFFKRIPPLLRTILALGACLLIVPEQYTDLMGLGLVALVLLPNALMGQKHATAP